MTSREPLRDYRSSRAVLIGTWNYQHLPPVPAAANSLKRMYRLLTGELCSWPANRVSVRRNEHGPGDLADWLITEFEQVNDVALFYFVGHGQIDDHNQLCLGLAGSRPEPRRRAATSLRFEAVRQAMLGSRAATKILILDCCFSGLANSPGNSLGPPVDVLETTVGTGAYTMAASGAYEPAWFETDVASPQTYFTKYLADLVEAGIASQQAGLRLHPIFIQLKENLARDHRAVPVSRNIDEAREFVFARNATPPDTHPGDQADSRAASGGDDATVATGHSGAGAVNRLGARRRLAWAGGFILAILVVTFAFTPGAVGDLRSAMFGHTTPSPGPHPNGRSSTPVVEPSLGAATVTGMKLLTTSPHPPRYEVHLRVTNLPSRGYTLWLVALIYPKHGVIKRTLYYAKATVPLATGNHSVQIRFCKSLKPDLHRGLEVVAADAQAAPVLARNRIEEDSITTCRNNPDLVNLAGAKPISAAYRFAVAP